MITSHCHRAHCTAAAPAAGSLSYSSSAQSPDWRSVDTYRGTRPAGGARGVPGAPGAGGAGGAGSAHGAAHGAAVTQSVWPAQDRQNTPTIEPPTDRRPAVGPSDRSGRFRRTPAHQRVQCMAAAPASRALQRQNTASPHLTVTPGR